MVTQYSQELFLAIACALAALAGDVLRISRAGLCRRGSREGLSRRLIFCRRVFFRSVLAFRTGGGGGGGDEDTTRAGLLCKLLRLSTRLVEVLLT